MVEVYGIGGFILLVLNIWAFVRIIGSTASTGAKVVWILVILLMPFIGFIVWLIFGPKK